MDTDEWRQHKGDEQASFTQQSPLFTDEFGSPFTATAFPFSVPTRIPQPTPQNRHGAFVHFKFPVLLMFRSCSSANSIPGNSVDAAAMADTAAILLRNFLLFTLFFIITLLISNWFQSQKP